MPVAGRKPNANGQHRHRVKPTYEWVEVLDVAYTGEVPALPAGSWSARTKRWWAGVSRMPHCVLWTETDWQFALDSLDVYEAFLVDPAKHSKTLMDREKQLGTTLDFRRDLRIRYVDDAEGQAEGAPVGVSRLADYRDAVGG